MSLEEIFLSLTTDETAAASKEDTAVSEEVPHA
jgi:hypothetical protein